MPWAAQTACKPSTRTLHLGDVEQEEKFYHRRLEDERTLYLFTNLFASTPALIRLRSSGDEPSAFPARRGLPMN